MTEPEQPERNWNSTTSMIARNEKKVIVNKLPQSAAATVVQWPFDDKLLIGLSDGKLRVGILSSNKCTSLYKTDEPVVSLSTNPRRTAFVSGHQDGSIIHFTFSSKTQMKICSVPGPPFCLAYTAHGIIAVCDRRLFSYTGYVCSPGRFAEVLGKKEISLTFQICMFAVRLRGKLMDPYYIGTLCGGVISIDCCLRRGMLNSRFETTYVAPSHVIIRDVNSGTKTNLVSQKGYAIENLKMMGKDRYVVAYTASSLILADNETGLSSEIDWQSGGNENVSVTKGGPSSSPMKKIAYLTDPTSLTITQGKRPREAPKKRWRDVIKKDLVEVIATEKMLWTEQSGDD
ncbi:hypothetical protein TELCIR_02511 [Teladorsagia circumcincta]|uniref:Uncharacterized protein n=1 Tax=Teladorsagia circumcincta TaxID=45464 RepID=A0A2G9UYV5_TELCI|nr:hypothetical protein TELCIR_02511 [Teladorsagia circumcincta]